MEATETVTRTTEATPTGTVETVERTVEHDEGDITESWLSAQFAGVAETVASRLSVLESQHQTILENQSQIINRIPSNLVELLSQQQSTITTLTNQLTELTTRLLTPPAQPPVTTVVEAEESAEVTLEPVAVAAPVETPRRKLRTV